MRLGEFSLSLPHAQISETLSHLFKKHTKTITTTKVC